jgi:anti-sigma factor RsiW
MRTSRLREHPNDEMLLAYLDGEMPNRRMRETRSHLKICWQCRSALSQLESQAEAISQLLSATSKFDSDRSARAKEKFLRWRTAFESSRRSFFRFQPPQLMGNVADVIPA